MVDAVGGCHRVGFNVTPTGCY